MKKVVVHPLDALDETVLETDIVVNATSLGTETSLVRLAREWGARVATDERMLLYQGVLAQKRWTTSARSDSTTTRNSSYDTVEKSAPSSCWPLAKQGILWWVWP
jgi:shikimate 5-dehydrogenase